MAALIEDQMHEYLKRKEKERCKTLEIEQEKQEKKTGKKGKKITERKVSKPWTRVPRETLCQEVDLLVMVSEYDYDLSNADFREYCRERGVFNVAGEEGSKRREYFLNHKKKKDEFLDDPYFQFAQESNGKKYRYTDDEMKTGWKTVEIGRAKLQDCWEIFSSAPSSP